MLVNLWTEDGAEPYLGAVASARYENKCDCGRPKVGGAIACHACYREAEQRRLALADAAAARRTGTK